MVSLRGNMEFVKEILPPYLFIACMEYFSRMLNQSTQHTDFNFHPKCCALGVSHLAFIDDVLLLCRCDMQSVSILNQQPFAFGRMIGLDTNAAKSSIYFDGVGESVKLAILCLAGFSEGSFPFRYLGVPLSPHRLLASQFSPLLQKLKSSIQSWMRKHLSYAGRLELINQFCMAWFNSGSVSFRFRVQLLPRSIAFVVAFSGLGTLVFLTLLLSPGKRFVFLNRKVAWLSQISGQETRVFFGKAAMKLSP